MTAALTFAVVAALMAAEAVVARRHERSLRRRGGIEPSDDVYGIMQVAYPASFIVMAIEGCWRGPAPSILVSVGASLFVIAKALKYWAIAALGERWTFKVLVLPGAPLVKSGPYAYLRHPNYVAVAGELIGMALMMGALFTGPPAVVGFGELMRRRIRVEERALARGLQR